MHILHTTHYKLPLNYNKKAYEACIYYTLHTIHYILTQVNSLVLFLLVPLPSCEIHPLVFEVLSEWSAVSLLRLSIHMQTAKTETAV